MGVLKDYKLDYFHNKRHIFINLGLFLSTSPRERDLHIDCMARPYLRPLMMLENEIVIIDYTYKRIRRVIYDLSGNILEHR